MRRDMARILYDTALHGGVPYRNRRLQLDNFGEEAPRHESMRKWAGEIGGWDGLKEKGGIRRNVLFRWFDKQVGRPWDDVYSEITQNFKGDVRLIELASHEVEKKTFMKDGEVYYVLGYVRNEERPIDECDEQFYVHPVDRTLQKTGRRFTKRRMLRRPAYKGVTIDATHQIHRIDGIYYIITLAPVPKKVREGSPNASRPPKWVTPPYKDVATADIVRSNYMGNWWYRTVANDALRVYGVKDVYACEKQQCNSKTLRKYNLQNDTRIRSS